MWLVARSVATSALTAKLMYAALGGGWGHVWIEAMAMCAYAYLT